MTSILAIMVITMPVDTSHVTAKSGKTYTRHLIREAYRDENGNPRLRTIANISKCSPEDIDAIKLALKHKKDLTELVSISKDITFEQGLSVGAVWTLWSLAKEVGVTDALGGQRQGKLALWQVFARMIDQGSRLKRRSVGRCPCRLRYTRPGGIL